VRSRPLGINTRAAGVQIKAMFALSMCREQKLGLPAAMVLT
jgi:hypothetical protein